MENILKRIQEISWTEVAMSLHEMGYARIANMLNDDECEWLKENYNHGDYRKTVVMERYRFGLGEYKYFNYPLPPIVETLRTEVYPKLVPVANDWLTGLGDEGAYPNSHTEMVERCRQAGQKLATPLILKYGQSGFNTLHQDIYGDVYFPMQMVVMLSEPGKDFEGGEFVMTQQIPRAQSKAIVQRPKKGDAIIFTTREKPQRGAKGFYRVNMKHGVSEVTKGERFTLGVIFHDATS